MGAGAITMCHDRATVQIKEDVKRMVQLPVLMQRLPTRRRRLFGVPLLELQEQGLVDDGVPLVVRHLVEFLKQHALQQEGLFRVNGNVRNVEDLRQKLESCKEVGMLQEADVCSVASLLKQFLRDLPEGVVTSSLQGALLQLYQECSEDKFKHALKEHLCQLPNVHYCLLRYLCQFLSQVAKHCEENRMTAPNLATVFGPNIFHVSPGLDGMKDQNICNKIMLKLIQGYEDIFQSCNNEINVNDLRGETSRVITVEEAQDSQNKVEEPERSDRTDMGQLNSIPKNNETTQSCPADSASSPEDMVRVKLTSPLRKKLKRVRSDGAALDVPQPDFSNGLPRLRPQPLVRTHHTPNGMSLSNSDNAASSDTLSSARDDERPVSPFYMSTVLSTTPYEAESGTVLERTIRSAVEHHLFGDTSSGPRSEHLRPAVLSYQAATARQRRRHQRAQDEAQRCRITDDTEKESIPAAEGRSKDAGEGQSQRGLAQEAVTRRQTEQNPRLLPDIMEHQDSLHSRGCLRPLQAQDRRPTVKMESRGNRRDDPEHGASALSSQTSAMKIQEAQSDVGRADGCEEVPRLDLTALTEDSHWGEPVPAYSSWQRESMDREEARLSPHSGQGRLIRQLLEEEGDPMLSPRFHTYGHCPQYLEDTEVPPSPPNAYSFMSRRRSSSLGSCDDDRGELTPAQISRKIHNLKKKIRKYEEKFEEERKYRPSHSDKAANPEVLRWMNELSKLRKDLKEHQLLKSEEDLPPLTRQRSNTLPKSFGSQLERRSPEKAPRPPVESTLDAVQKKLQEKRAEVGRPEDIKDMTREQIVAEKVALQKALLHYESIHGRPVTDGERQAMKPLYDRYRLVKQILCRASAIPVIGSPSSKRRGPLLQPIIEGVPALFFDKVKEEEDGSEDDGNAKSQMAITAKSDFSMLGFLEHLEEDGDGFVSPVDELSPPKTSMDMRLSNLHSATMQELVEQLQETREEKKRLRKNLREFEDQFFRQNGRNVQKEDRSPLAEEYNEYKHVKAKLKLLEVLISKRDSSKFI